MKASLIEKLLSKIGTVHPDCADYKPFAYELHNELIIVKLTRIDGSHSTTYCVDVWIDDAGDVQADWNQIEFNTHSSEDVERLEVQSKPDEFSCATSEAICYLESQGVISQDKNGKWSLIAEIPEIA